jgi:hypothetical protein
MTEPPLRGGSRVPPFRVVPCCSVVPFHALCVGTETNAALRETAIFRKNGMKRRVASAA